MARKREFTYDSSDGRTKIHGIEWRPEKGEIRGVVQIVHGMVEFVGRYEEFAEFLTGKGFLVTGNDHLGHGASVASKEDYGFFAEKNGNRAVLKDIHRLRRMTEKRCPGVPYFMLGHSMGSFLLRQYLCMNGQGLCGAIVMGTGTQPRAVLWAGRGVCRVMAAFGGWHYRSALVDRMAFGGYNRKFEPARTDKDWLTKEEAVVDRYLADERCTFRFTVNGYYNLFTSIAEASRKGNLERMPKELPVFFVAGGDDPVGNFGKGVEQVRKRFQAAGLSDVSWKIYDRDRHEILNETDRQTVYEDLECWLEEKLKKAGRSQGEGHV